MQRFAGVVALVLCACSAEGTGGGGTGAGMDAGGAAGDAGGGGGWDGGPRPDVVIPGTDAACERIDIESMPGTANVLVVLDRSGSMYDVGPFGSGVDRWTPAVAAIDSVTAALDDQIRFGLMMFPGSTAECGAGAVDVPIAPMSASAITSALAGDPATKTGGGTPTASTLMAVPPAFTSLDGEHYVLLVTDGAPNCNASLSGASCRCTAPGGGCFLNNENCLDDMRAVDAVRSLADAGIRTYVIGYDTGDWADVLDAMAAAGGTDRTTYIPVDDGASLETALRDIGGSVISCSIELAMAPGDVRYVRVTVDGTTVDHESVGGTGDGWTLEGDRTITLVGAPCDTVRDGEHHEISVVVECTPVII